MIIYDDIQYVADRCTAIAWVFLVLFSHYIIADPCASGFGVVEWRPPRPRLLSCHRLE